MVGRLSDAVVLSDEECHFERSDPGLAALTCL